MLVSCGDMIYDESDQVTYADKEHLTSDADTLWSVAGIINKMQVIADRTILLGEMRGDLVDITSNSSADLRELAFSTSSRIFETVDSPNAFVVFTFSPPLWWVILPRQSQRPARSVLSAA